MKLVTFENSVRQSRIGAVTGGDRIVDLNSAYALYLRDVREEGAYARMADAVVPANMRALFEGGDTSLDAARTAVRARPEADVTMRQECTASLSSTQSPMSI